MNNFKINLQLHSDDDFSDVVIEDTATPSAEIEQQPVETVEDTKPTDTQPVQTETPKVKLKYNHEEKEYSLDDVVPLAQKGLNYDKLQDKLNAIQSDPRLNKYDKVQQLAELYGMSDEDMLDSLYSQYYETAAEKQGLTAEQIKKDHELAQKERAIQQKEAAINKADADKSMYSNFLKQFPGIKPEDISAETWQLVEKGVDLTAAYIEQRNKDLEKRLKTMEQNAENAKRAPVASVTTHGTQDIVDKDFIGFDD